MPQIRWMPIALAALALAGRDDDDPVAPEPTPVAFEVRVENVSTVFPIIDGGVFDTPSGAGMPGPLTPGHVFEATFGAGPSHRLHFATMFGQSNDFFYAPSPEGIALYVDGAPVTGDVTDQVSLWDAGTEADQEPGAGSDQAPRQAGPDTGADDPDPDVRLASDAFGNLPAVDAVLRAELDYLGGGRFRLRITNVSDATTLMTSEGPTPVFLAPGLRVLQQREVVPVGASRPVEVDVRLIAATNRDLEEAVEAGEFRRDLLFRLDVYRLELPPVRCRTGDIPVLVEHFLRGKAGRRGPPPSLSPLAMRTLLSYPWPGNVRELFAALEGALIRAGGGPVQAAHLPATVRQGSEAPARDRYRAEAETPDEKAAIERALEQAEGVRVRAAELLGMGRTTLWRKMKEYGLE